MTGTLTESRRVSAGLSLHWLGRLDVSERKAFFASLAEAAATAAAEDSPEPIEQCLREWRTIGAALETAGMREFLLES